jgi:hypothetical protein
MYTMAPDPLGGLRCAACPVASDPASQLGGLWDTMCHAVPGGSRATSIKKSLADLPVQLGLRVLNERAQASKVPDIRVSMGMQDVRVDNIFNACKTCRQTATVRL